MSRAHGDEHEVAVTRQALAQTIGSALSSDSTGSSVDRSSLKWPRSMIITVNGANGLGNSNDDITFTLQESSDDSSWSDTSTTIQITNSNKRNTVEVDLTGLDQYVRLQHDVDDPSGQALNADVDVVAEFVFFGMKVVPQS